ncbi:MAG TPA: hypothetical protein VM840_04250 [Actinomycetota bacterium]|nr:hypothetical protein [Actinomycetota bacterium]
MRKVWLLIAAMALVGTPARAGHIESYVIPAEPQREFPADFELPVDAQARGELYSWTDPRVGGWGGRFEGAEVCPDGHELRAPVVLVHGTSEDAYAAWRASDNGSTTVNVRQRLLDAGWCPEELWAISYTGGRGYFTYNDVNVDELHAFIQNVRAYTGADRVDVVAHSLGVTVVRKAMRVHGYEWLRRFVAIGGANHGTTTCRGVGQVRGSHVCEELEPDSPTFTNAWLADLNSIGETPPGPEYLVIYDSVGDQFYQGPDAHSPRLDGACNLDLPGRFHLPIARGPEAVAVYGAFLADGSLPVCS